MKIGNGITSERGSALDDVVQSNRELVDQMKELIDKDDKDAQKRLKAKTASEKHVDSSDFQEMVLERVTEETEKLKAEKERERTQHRRRSVGAGSLGKEPDAAGKVATAAQERKSVDEGLRVEIGKATVKEAASSPEARASQTKEDKEDREYRAAGCLDVDFDGPVTNELIQCKLLKAHRKFKTATAQRDEIFQQETLKIEANSEPASKQHSSRRRGSSHKPVHTPPVYAGLAPELNASKDSMFWKKLVAPKPRNNETAERPEGDHNSVIPESGGQQVEQMLKKLKNMHANKNLSYTPQHEKVKPKATPALKRDSSEAKSAETKEEEPDVELNHDYAGSTVTQLLDATGPAVKKLFLSRKPHPGPFLHLMWPAERKEQSLPVHVQMHQQQFVEDGSVGKQSNDAKQSTQTCAHLDYLLAGYEKPVLGRFFFHGGLIKHLPKKEHNWHYGRCAVVSNSANVLTRLDGIDIDDMDAVFRINYPPTEGYEEHVGSKTTFDLVNHHNLQLLVSSGTKRHPTFPPGHKTFRAPPDKPLDGKSTLVLIESPNSEGWRFQLLPKVYQKLPQGRIAILSPDFVTMSEEVWRRVSHDMAGRGEWCRKARRKAELEAMTNKFSRINAILDVCKPTSGWFALMFAAQLCDEVHLYGYSDWKKSSMGAPRGEDGKEEIRYHYFDNITGFTNVHSFELSMRVYRKLAEYYPIYIHA
eukprot:gene3174-4017_t